MSQDCLVSKVFKMFACGVCFPLLLLFAHRSPCTVPNPITLVVSTALLRLDACTVCKMKPEVALR